MAFPCQVLDLVPATLGAAGYNRGVRAGCLRLLRLGGLMVPTEEERLPVRVSISVRGLSAVNFFHGRTLPLSALFASLCLIRFLLTLASR
jgi:hypothetical protein